MVKAPTKEIKKQDRDNEILGIYDATSGRYATTFNPEALSAKYIRERGGEYVRQALEAGNPLMVSGLAATLGVPSRYLGLLRNKEAVRAYEKLKGFIEMDAEKRGIKAANPIFHIFRLKQMGWTDTPQTQVSNQTLNITMYGSNDRLALVHKAKIENKQNKIAPVVKYAICDTTKDKDLTSPSSDVAIANNMNDGGEGGGTVSNNNITAPHTNFPNKNGNSDTPNVDFSHKNDTADTDSFHPDGCKKTKSPNRFAGGHTGSGECRFTKDKLDSFGRFKFGRPIVPKPIPN